MSFTVEASNSDPRLREGYARDNLVNYMPCPTRPEAKEQVHRYHRAGYWTEVYHQASGELLAGPFDPDQPLPVYIV